MAKIVQRHEKIGGEDVRLMLDLPVFGIPPDDVLFAAAKAVRIGEAMQKKMTELMGKGKIYASLGAHSTVINDSPAFAARRRLK